MRTRIQKIINDPNADKWDLEAAAIAMKARADGTFDNYQSTSASSNCKLDRTDKTWELINKEAIKWSDSLWRGDVSSGRTFFTFSAVGPTVTVVAQYEFWSGLYQNLGYLQFIVGKNTDYDIAHERSTDDVGDFALYTTVTLPSSSKEFFSSWAAELKKNPLYNNRNGVSIEDMEEIIKCSAKNAISQIFSFGTNFGDSNTPTFDPKYEQGLGKDITPDSPRLPVKGLGANNDSVALNGNFDQNHVKGLVGALVIGGGVGLGVLVSLVVLAWHCLKGSRNRSSEITDGGERGISPIKKKKTDAVNKVGEFCSVNPSGTKQVDQDNIGAAVLQRAVLPLNLVKDGSIPSGLTEPKGGAQSNRRAAVQRRPGDSAAITTTGGQKPSERRRFGSVPSGSTEQGGRAQGNSRVAEQRMVWPSPSPTLLRSSKFKLISREAAASQRLGL